MARGMPSMTALLALLAVAGYQNRDKIAEWLGGTGQGKPGPPGKAASAAWSPSSATVSAVPMPAEF